MEQKKTNRVPHIFLMLSMFIWFTFNFVLFNPVFIVCYDIFMGWFWPLWEWIRDRVQSHRWAATWYAVHKNHWAHVINDDSREVRVRQNNRVIPSKLLLNKLKNPVDPSITFLFSDENFDHDQKVNKRRRPNGGTQIICDDAGSFEQRGACHDDAPPFLPSRCWRRSSSLTSTEMAVRV